MASYSPDQQLHASLCKPLTFPGSFESVKIEGICYDMLEISLRRTIRVPDSDQSYDLPPDCGPFPLYSIADHKDKLPQDLVAKGGIFVPVRQREALWINFSSYQSFAIKVYVGGVNAISGESKAGDGKHGEMVQDYVVTPQQDWLDGIAREDGTVSQFVAAVSGSGYSVESQVAGSDFICGLQIEIIPRKATVVNDNLGGVSGVVFIKTLTGKILPFNIPMALMVEDLKSLIMTREGIPPDQQRLVFDGKQMMDNQSLSASGVTPGDQINLILRLRGGGAPSKKDIVAVAEAKLVKELAIAPGGFIEQTIAKDDLSPEDWDTERSIMFNVQLFDAAHFSNIGLPIPPTPITAETYSENGYPFFKKYEDPSGISGSFDIKSIGQLDKETGVNQDVHDAEKLISFPKVIISGTPWGHVRSTPVSINTKDPISTFIPIRLRKEAKD